MVCGEGSRTARGGLGVSSQLEKRAVVVRLTLVVEKVVQDRRLADARVACEREEDEVSDCTASRLARASPGGRASAPMTISLQR